MRKLIFGTIAAALVVLGLCPPALAAGPMTQAAFSRYVRLFNSGDVRYADYYAPDVTTDADGPVRGRNAVVEADRKLRADYEIRFEPGDVFISDTNDGVAALMTIRQVAKRDGLALGAQPQPIRRGDALVRQTVIFYGLSDGKIASIRESRSGSPPRPLPAAAAGSLDGPRMTRAKFADYARRFSAWDLSFTRYYEPDVVFATAPAPKPLHGPQEIIDLYTPLRANLDEHVTPGAVVIDTARGMMVAEIANRMTATRGDVQLPSALMKKGDTREGAGVMLYSLRNGRIAEIKAASRTVRFEPAARP
jgi:hypothetical protein